MTELLFCQGCRVVKLHVFADGSATCIRCGLTRTVAAGSAPTCPTPANNDCGICDSCVTRQEQAEAARLADAVRADLVEHGMPSDIYP